MSAPEFGFSSNGSPIIIFEAPPLSIVRLFMIMLTCVLGISCLIFIFNSKNKFSNLPGILTLFCVHYVIHTVHYADNIARPVEYFEPTWLYNPTFFSAMDKTFLFNWPYSIFSSIWFCKLISYLNGNVEKVSRNFLWFGLLLYSLGSLLTLMHYSIETPPHYSLFVNFTIGGEGVALFFFILFTSLSLFNSPSNPSSSSSSGYAKLNSIEMDDEEIMAREETIRKSVRQRSRERKPTSTK